MLKSKSKHTLFSCLPGVCLAVCAFNLNAQDRIPLNLSIHLTVDTNTTPLVLDYPTNDYMSLYPGEKLLDLSSSKQYPFGLVRFKADRAMRVRGWEVRDNIYFGQAKVGEKWGVGVVFDRGSHYYGINNRGVSFLKKF